PLNRRVSKVQEGKFGGSPDHCSRRRLESVVNSSAIHSNCPSELMKNASTAVALLLLMLFSCQAENWPHWRGPNFNGSSTEKNLPATFSKTEHVKWFAELPGPSAATPVIWDTHVFVSSGEEATKSLHALGLERKSGKVLWNHEVGIGYSSDNRSNFASPSPVTDGKVVVFLYGNGELAAFDFAGK